MEHKWLEKQALSVDGKHYTSEMKTKNRKSVHIY